MNKTLSLEGLGDMKDYYAALGITKEAKSEEVKQAYLRMVRRHDPDITGYARGPIFTLIQEAYDVLRDEAKRKIYDAEVAKESKTWVHFPY